MTGHMLGDLSESSQKAAPLPEVNNSQPLNDLLPNQTGDQSLLYFTINNSDVQNKKVETKLGDFPEAVQIATPLPKEDVSQPLNNLSSNQTQSQPCLSFSINEYRKAIYFLLAFFLIIC